MGPYTMALSPAQVYKQAKEAFHADNAGSSIMSINAISLAALSSYALYAARARSRPNPSWDYLETVLPLLLAITLFAPQPLIFNGWLLCLFGIVIQRRQRRLAEASFRALGRNKLQAKPRGKWLEESDSDEEPSQPTAPRPARSGVPVPLPSEVVALASSTSALDSPTSSALSSETSELRSRTRQTRRSSLDGSIMADDTTDHTSIEVLPTPELLPNGALAAQQASYPSVRHRRSHSGSSAAAMKVDSSNRLPFLSVYRAHMMVMTMHAILAVDFPVFPRWLGKTETFGTSLMDIGVGSFVFSLGVISTKSYMVDISVWPFVVKSVRKAIPVISLGMVRVVMVKGVEYPEHVTEYGVHWNFFFTLALMPVLAALAWPMKRRGVSWAVLGVLCTAWHQMILSTTSVQAWALSPLRSASSLLSQNKEGLTSLPGYLAIYLFGLATGQLVLKLRLEGQWTKSGTEVQRQIGTAQHASEAEKETKRKTELALELCGYAVAYWTVLAVLRLGGVQVSRRMANLPYVIWTAAYNTSFILGYLCIEIFAFPPSPSADEPSFHSDALPTDPTGKRCPPLLEAINKNGLVIFLAANLLTGVVNLGIQTMYADWPVSMPVLVVYSMVLSGLAWVLRRHRIWL